MPRAATRTARSTRRARAAERQLLQLIRAARIPPEQCTVQVVDADARHGIPRLARTKAADLVALGMRSRKGLGRLMLGSVAARAVRACDTDVLAIPPVD